MSMLSVMPNAARWFGVRPGHKGDAAHAYATANGAATATMYTVPTGKTLFISSVWMNSAGSSSGGYDTLDVYQSDGTTFYYMLLSTTPKDTNGSSAALAPFHPIEVPSGYIIKLNGTGNLAIAGFHGWTE